MKQLNSANLTSQFFRYTFLNILSMLGLSFYILADTIIIASAAGNDGLTALNLALPAFSLMSALGQMVAMGASALFSAYKGNNDGLSANRIFTVGIYISAVISLIVFICGLFFSAPICTLLGADESMLSLTDGYLKILLLFGPAFVFNNLFTYFVRNDSNPKLAMCAMLASSISNVFLDMLFVFVFKMGIQGAAIATGISPILSLIILSLHFITKRNTVKLAFHIPAPERIFKVITIGSPVFVTECAFGVVMLAINYTVLGLTGNVGVAAYSIISNVALVAKSFFSGIAQGVQPLVSFSCGRNDGESIRKLCIMAVIMSAVTGVVLYLLCVIFKTPLIDIFNTDRDPEMARIAAEGVPMYFPAFIIMGINMFAEVFFSSVQKPARSFIISVLRGLVIVLIMIAVLPPVMGMTGVWIAVPLTEIIVCAFALPSMLVWTSRNKQLKS